MTKNEQFFYDHAGWSYDPKTETSEQGRIRCAIDYAKAESDGREAGLSFEWYQDTLTSKEFSNKRPFYPLWVCVCHGPDGETLSSLFGIDFGRDGEPWGDNYRRVVEAELAAESLTELETVEQ